eukprot:CCRYP_011147-RA/>CCRYP_011147-RA protein AED:0.18 eAED:0.18 QI:126/1/1/1/0/0/2/536/140
MTTAMTDATPKRAKIILFGDSITQMSFSSSECGWGAFLADRYQRRADVYNRGFSGYNTSWFLKFAATDAVPRDLLRASYVRLSSAYPPGASKLPPSTILCIALEVAILPYGERTHSRDIPIKNPFPYYFVTSIILPSRTG